MTGFAQILDGLQVLCGCGKGRNGSGIKWLADCFGQRAYMWNLKMLHNQVKPRPAHYNKEAFIEFFLCVSQHADWTLNGIPYSGMRENELVLCCRLFPALYCHGSIRL